MLFAMPWILLICGKNQIGAKVSEGFLQHLLPHLLCPTEAPFWQKLLGADLHRDFVKCGPEVERAILESVAAIIKRELTEALDRGFAIRYTNEKKTIHTRGLLALTRDGLCIAIETPYDCPDSGWLTTAYFHRSILTDLSCTYRWRRASKRLVETYARMNKHHGRYIISAIHEHRTGEEDEQVLRSEIEFVDPARWGFAMDQNGTWIWTGKMPKWDAAVTRMIPAVTLAPRFGK